MTNRTADNRAATLRSEIESLFAQPSKRKITQTEALHVLARLDGLRNHHVAATLNKTPLAPAHGFEEASPYTPDEAIFHDGTFPGLIAAARRFLPELDERGTPMDGPAQDGTCLVPGVRQAVYPSSQWRGGAVSTKAFYTVVDEGFGPTLMAITVHGSRPRSISLGPVDEVDETVRLIRAHAAGADATLLVIPPADHNNAATNAEIGRELARIVLLAAGIDAAEANRLADKATWMNELGVYKSVLRIGEKIHIATSGITHRKVGEVPAYDGETSAVLWRTSPTGHGPMLDLATGDTRKHIAKNWRDYQTAHDGSHTELDDAASVSKAYLDATDCEVWFDNYAGPLEDAEPRVSLWDSTNAAVRHAVATNADLLG